MDIYKLISEITDSNDLVNCGKKLLVFADQVFSEKYRIPYVNELYGSITDQINIYYVNYAFSERKEKYVIFDGNKSVARFLALTMPAQETPVKTLKAIKEYGQMLVSSYIAPIGNIVCRDKVKEIMDYLDEKYNFSSKVFKDKLAFIILLNNSHIHFKSHCFVRDLTGSPEQHIFLYYMNSIDSKPETSFFHEIGHVLLTRFTCDTNTEPSTILKWVEQLYTQNNATYDLSEQEEILADLLSIGLMYDSPYEEFMPLSYADEKFKTIMKKLAEQIINEIKL